MTVQRFRASRTLLTSEDLRICGSHAIRRLRERVNLPAGIYLREKAAIQAHALQLDGRLGDPW